MANVCINYNDPAFIALQEMSGLSTPTLHHYCAKYIEEHGVMPTIDHVMHKSDSSKHLIKTYNLVKLGNVYTTKDGSIPNQIDINNTYRDLEVEVKESVRGTPFITIKQRALPNRDLDVEEDATIFTNNDDVEVFQPINKVGDNYIYYYNNKYYTTNNLISDPSLLKNEILYNTQEEAENADARLTSISGQVFRDIKNLFLKLKNGGNVTITTEENLPTEIEILDKFIYPFFIFSSTVETSQDINGVIVINPNAIHLSKDLERLILKAKGFSDSLTESILDTFHQSTTITSIKTSPNTYTLQVKKSEMPVITLQIVKNVLGKNNLEFLLDRLEDLYGIHFNRVTTEDLLEGSFTELISDATKVNAFIYNGEIFINTDNARSDAPIHELAHLILGTLRQTNPELYMQLVSSVEQLEDYEYLVSLYDNRTRADINEEIFVDKFAKHFTQNFLLDLDPELVELSEYEIKRNIDSAIFPNTSTTKVSLKDLMHKSFEEIMDIFGTTINRDNILSAFDSNLGTASRKIANYKEKLMKNGDLKEFCNG